MKFVRCHRLGGYQNGRNKYNNHNRQVTQRRPIIIRFCHFHDKSLVWSARNRITNDKLFICEKFSPETEYNRNKLYAIYKRAKSLEKYKLKISLNADVLIIDSVRYTVDNLSELPDDLQPRQFSERINQKYHVFGGLYSSFCPFSNWSPCSIQYKGHSFKSLEQAYQYAKAIHGDDAETAMTLIHTSDPKTAKDLGSKVKGLDTTGWDDEKYNIMTDLVRIKFAGNPSLKTELLNTGKKTLVESGRDTHYAIGLSITSKDIFNKDKWMGKNKLGDILCCIREELRNK